MPKRYIIFLGLTTILLLIGIYLISVSLMYSVNVIKTPKLDKEITIDSIDIHFSHGLTENSNCELCPTRLGGKFGGHVEIAIDSFIYGFNKDSLGYFIFPKSNSDNSKIEKIEISKWLENSEKNLITTIRIPVSRNQKNVLINSIVTDTENPKYDYAVFGHRCTSMCAKWLGESSILSELSNTKIIISNFQPSQLRFRLLKFAQKNEYPIKLTSKGTECCEWETIDNKWYDIIG